MNKSRVTPQLRIALLAAAALASQGETLSPTALTGMRTVYPISLVSGGPNEKVSYTPDRKPQGFKARDTDNGVELFRDDGTKVGVIGKNGYKESYGEAAQALLSEGPTTEQTASAGKSPAPPPKSESIQAEATGQQGKHCLGISLPPNPAGDLPVRPGLPVAQETTGQTPSGGNAGGVSRSPASATSGGGVLPGAGISTLPILAGDSSLAGKPAVSSNGAAGPAWSGIYSGASNIADLASGNEVVASATDAMQRNNLAAGQDTRVLNDYYKSLGPAAIADNLRRSQRALGDAADAFDSATGGSLDSSERARFRNYYLNARDKAQLGLDALGLEKDSDVFSVRSPFLGLLPKIDGPKPPLNDIFGPETAPASADGNINRILLLNGLPDEERAQALQRLKLLEHAKLTLPNGTLSLDLPHNGYILGAGASGMDCSSFVSSVLPADFRRGRFTTLDFRAMWIYAKTQEFPDIPRYSPERAKLLMETSTGFIPIDLYAGQSLRPGDILVYRLQNDPIGHVVIVRSYNGLTLRAEIIEAAQSSGNVRERTLNLSPDPLSSPHRVLMPGLWVLRLKPVSNRACAYRDPARAARSASGQVDPPTGFQLESPKSRGGAQ